jgi:hypothetical protein
MHSHYRHELTSKSTILHRVTMVHPTPGYVHKILASLLYLSILICALCYNGCLAYNIPHICSFFTMLCSLKLSFSLYIYLFEISSSSSSLNSRSPFTYLYIMIRGLLTPHNELATTHARLVTTHYELDTTHARLVFLDFALVVLSCPPSSPLSSLFFLDLLDLLYSLSSSSFTLPMPFPCTSSLLIVPSPKLEPPIEKCNFFIINFFIKDGIMSLNGDRFHKTP